MITEEDIKVGLKKAKKLDKKWRKMDKEIDKII